MGAPQACGPSKTHNRGHGCSKWWIQPNGPGWSNSGTVHMHLFILILFYLFAMVYMLQGNLRVVYDHIVHPIAQPLGIWFMFGILKTWR